MSSRTRLAIVLAIVLLVNTFSACPAISSEGTDEFKSLFEGVSQITLSGAPGMLVCNGAAVPLVLSSEKSTPPYSVVFAGAKVGIGLVIAVCHDSFLSDANFELLDNEQFMSNVFARQSKKRVLISVSHGEYLNRSSSSRFVAFAGTKGYQVVYGDTALTDGVLDGVGILISGVAWTDFPDAEIQTVATFVQGGGVFIVCGVGWSWLAYHPGKTLNDYPANKVSSQFGIEFVDGVTQEPPENHYAGASVFRLFYPDTLSHSFSVDSALALISEDLGAHANDLNSVLTSSPDRLDAWSLCLETLYKNAAVLPRAKRDEVFSKIDQLVREHPYYFQKDHVLNKDTESAIAWIREKMAILLYACSLPLSAERASLIGETLNLQDTYGTIWREFGVLVLDNNSLYEKNLQVLYDLLTSLPREAHDLKLVLVGKLLGPPARNLYLLYPDEKNLIFDLGDAFATETEIGHAIDVWDVHVDQQYENPFPGDAPSRQFPVFTSALAHELTHVIDGYLVYADPGLSTERQRLLGNAGDTPLNYLRSMFETGFFTKAPREFLASIGNQYFCDSRNTLALAMNRFDAGYREPLNQFLFFIRVLSMGANSVPFYGSTANCTRLAKTDVQIKRDVHGRIVQIDDPANWRTYTFGLDGSGDVLQYNAAASSYVLAATACPLAGGSIGRSPDAASYTPGTAVTLTALPTPGWHFVGWTGTAQDATDPLKTTVTMDADKAVTATFQLEPPPSVTLSSPTNGATVSIPTVTLSWSLASGATRYDVALDTSSNFTYPVTWSVTETSQTTSALSQNTTYYWRVASVNVGGTSAWSPVFSFTTRKPQVTLTLTLQLGNTRMQVGGSDGTSDTVTLDAAPVLGAGNRTLVPVRAVAEAMGGTVDWNAATKTASISVGSNTLELTLGKNTAYYNGAATAIDSDPKVVPVIINGRTLLPLRFVVESLGAQVSYDQATKTITITYTKT